MLGLVFSSHSGKQPVHASTTVFLSSAQLCDCIECDYQSSRNEGNFRRKPSNIHIFYFEAIQVLRYYRDQDNRSVAYGALLVLAIRRKLLLCSAWTVIVMQTNKVDRGRMPFAMSK